MRVPSISSNGVRVAPQQERSARRLAGFLQAAAELFTDLGFEATTMQAIADRSQSSIGALYNYFPDKAAVAFAIMRQYSDELHAYWKPLQGQGARLSHAQFAEFLIDRIIEFVQERPAFLQLQAAPIRFRQDPAVRRALRTVLANAFRAKNPSLSPERAMLTANVAVQIIKAMMALYQESDSKTRPLIVSEFRTILASYLDGVLSE